MINLSWVIGRRPIDKLSAKEKVNYVEWRCGGCQSVNPISNRECSHCGSPRMLLAQEMLREEGLW